MNYRISHFIISLLLLTVYPLKARSEMVLEEIQRTGVLKIALRQDAPPFGYLNSAGEWSGFCLDFIDKLQQKVKQELGRDVLLVKLYKSTLYNRFETVNNKVAYLECGPNTIQNNSAIKADFSTFFWISGTQFLIRKENYQEFGVNGNLKDFKVGVLSYTSTQKFLAGRYPQAILREFQGVTGRRRGIQALQQKQIDAFAGDGILLLGEAVLQGLFLGENYRLVPEYPLSCEYYGLILPQGDSQWRNLVNSVIESERSQSIYRTWFGNELSTTLEKMQKFCSTSPLLHFSTTIIL
jgi:polar amino acid transport system substrate-binding protein